MNNGKFIRKNFDFLCKYGFKRKQFTNGIDYEVCYKKSTFDICIICAIVFNPDELEIDLKNECCKFTNDNDSKYLEKQLNEHCYMAVDVLLYYGIEKSNLYECKLFEETELHNLKRNIDFCGKDIYKQIEEYAKFFKNNLTKIVCY